MNFLKLCDDLIGKVEDEVKKHPKYKFRKTLININYSGTHRNDYEHPVYPINFMRPIIKPRDGKFIRCPCLPAEHGNPNYEKLMNYWIMRHIYEALCGYGCSVNYTIERLQISKLWRLGTYNFFEDWEKQGANLIQHIDEDDNVYYEYDYEPDWEDEF
jgi:hypothetical protein